MKFLFLIFLLLPFFGCKHGEHNKNYTLHVDGTIVDINGVPISGAEVEYSFGSQCCAPNSPNLVAAICKYTTGADGKWSSDSQVCASDNCSCDLTVKKSGLTDKSQTFSYSGTSNSTVPVTVIMQ